MSHHDNTELGKYKIVGQVGEGAMGVVYRAIDPVLNRTVAIKVMSDGIARDDDLRNRFLREAQAAGSLQHPNVITIYDCGEVDGHLFIAMEFVEGHDLETLLDGHASLSLVAKIDIVIDVLGGLAYAHKRGIVHRDIKPANIRIDEEGRARIMDFGIAHLQSSSMTRTGVIVGTPAYMAPEQITGQSISPGTDIFSVGAVLFELLTGVRPFHADTLQGVMYKIVSESPSDLSTLSTGLPPAINTIVQRALAKDPKERYATALDMANDLTTVRSGLDRTTIMKSVSLRSVIDTRLSDKREAQGKAAQKRGVLIGGSVAAGIAIVAFAFWVARPHSPPAAPQTAEGAPSSTIAPPLAAPPATSATQQPSSGAVGGTQSAATVGTTPTPPATKSANESKPLAADPKSAAQRTTAKQAPPPRPNTTAVAPTAQELALFRTLRTSALDVRKRAADAGAAADQLQAGDDHTKAADAAIAQGKISEAADHLNQATASWTSAERDARAAAAAAASANAARRTDPVKQAAATPPAPTNPAPVSAPAAVVTPAPAPSNPTVEIHGAVAAYARAIESRDVAEVRRAYPGITAAQADGFEQFFGTVRSLKATFSVTELDVTGATADAKLVGAYDYVTTGGKAERQPVSFQANFRREGGSWKLVSVR